MIKIAVVGNLAGSGYMMERALAQNHIKTRLFIGNREKDIALPTWENSIQEEPKLFLFRYGVKIWKEGSYLMSRWTILKHELSCLICIPKLVWSQLIYSYSTALFDSRIWEYVFGHFTIRPYVAFAAGSDIREVAALESNKYGDRVRLFFRKAKKVLLLNIDMVEVADRLKLTNAEFFPFSIDTFKYAPRKVTKKYCEEDDLLIFMPSHLDWGQIDNAPHRNSTKGNDRLIKAFARFIHAGNKGHLILLDRGPDKDIAKTMVDNLNISDKVSFLPQMKKNELIEHYNMADVLADQFDIGSFGTTGLEAMACGKPLLIYINTICAARCYEEQPPVVNSKTEEEIYLNLIKLKNQDIRDQIGLQSRSWVLKFHDSKIVSKKLIEIYGKIVKKNDE